MINLKNIKKKYDKDYVLDDVSLDIEKGEFLSIVGRSGSGKTSLLNIIGGLDSKFEGSVLVDNKKLKEMNDKELSFYRNKNIGFVFQSFNILNHLSAYENVALVNRFSEIKLNKKELDKQIRDVFTSLNLEDKINSLPSDLSGGQRQRIAIARAIVNNPLILLCDEPTGNLDKKTGLELIDVFRKLNKEKNITIIIISHEEHIAKLTDRMITIKDGKILKDEKLK